MLILIVFAILAVIFTLIAKELTKSSKNPLKVFFCFQPVLLLSAIFIIICMLAPVEYGEIEVNAEYELLSFETSEGQEVYAIFNGYNYVIKMNDEYGKSAKYTVSNANNIIYIDDDEIPKIREYVKKAKWTWYSIPLSQDKLSYALYIPEGGTYYDFEHLL